MNNVHAELKHRKEEVAQYQENINVCKLLLESLPTEWPDRLVQFRDEVDRHEAASKIEDLDDVVLYSKLVFRDELHKQIRAETFEMTKAKTILEKQEKDVDELRSSRSSR